MTKVLFSVGFMILASLAGCGDDPDRISDPPAAMVAATVTEAGPPAQMPSGLPGGPDAGARDASIDRDPGYRDPLKGGGGCSAPNKLCGGDPDAGPDAGPPVCVAIGTDVDNCGACGNQCSGPSASCVGSQCSCTAVGFDYCIGTGCMDVTADPNNCGACGKVCPPEATACVAGACIPDK